MPTNVPDAAWRLFLAVWPTPGEREQLLAHADRWQWSTGARRTLPERLHLTLHFIGGVAACRVPAVADALAVPFEPFELRLDHAEVWPGGIAVLGATEVPPALGGLQARLGDALGRLDLPRETRPYRPHVTLARKAQGCRPPAGDVMLTWDARGGYALVRSLPGAEGYRTLRHYAAPPGPG